MHTEPTAAGARRRIQALIARAWGPRQSSRRQNPGRYGPQGATSAGALHVRGHRRRRRRVRGALGRQPPQATEQERAAAAAHQRHARIAGFAPPMAWDDDEIDQPGARPAEGWRRTREHKTPAADLVEDAEFVRQTGGYRQASVGAVAMRLGVPRNRLEKALERTRAREAMADREAG